MASSLVSMAFLSPVRSMFVEAFWEMVARCAPLQAAGGSPRTVMKHRNRYHPIAGTLAISVRRPTTVDYSQFFMYYEPLAMATTQQITTAEQLLEAPGLGRCELLRGELVRKKAKKRGASLILATLVGNNSLL